MEITTPNPELMVKSARSILARTKNPLAASLGISDEFVHVGQWIHLLVYPLGPGVKTLDALNLLEDVEKKLRKEFDWPNILIVPASPETSPASQD